MTDEEIISKAFEPLAERRARNARVVAAAAKELGTREAARRFNISKNTVTDYLRLSNGVEPSILSLKIWRDGPRGYKAAAKGVVRQLRGKVRNSVPFSCTVEALTMREVLEAVVHQALVVARKSARWELETKDTSDMELGITTKGKLRAR